MTKAQALKENAVLGENVVKLKQQVQELQQHVLTQQRAIDVLTQKRERQDLAIQVASEALKLA